MKPHHRLVFVLLALAPVVATSTPSDSLLVQSQIALRAGDAKTAVQRAEAAVAATPDDAAAHAQLGLACSQRIGQVNFLHQARLASQMKAAFERAIELNPDQFSARIGLIRYYASAPAIAGGSRERALAEAEELRRRHPFLGLRELASLAQSAGEPDVAIQHYTAAAALQPRDAQVQQQLGALHEQSGRRPEARTHYAQAAALDPELAAARDALARLGATP